MRMTQAQAIEAIEAFNTSPDFICTGLGGYVEAFVAGMDAEGAEAFLEVHIASIGRPIEPESIIVRPDQAEGLDCAHIIIKTEE